MADQDLTEFYERVARIEKARAQGFGFEAEGTLGRSHYYRPTRRTPRIIGPLFVVIACFFAVKAAMHQEVGDALYRQRVDQMRASSGIERLGGIIMKADPVTLWLSRQLGALLH